MRILLSLLLLATGVQAQQVNFTWVKQIGGSLPTIGDGAFSVAYDNNENIFVCGQLAGSGDLDPGPGIQSYNSFGWIDAYVMKLDRNGNLLWARQMGGPESDAALSLATDAAGNVYITGYFAGTANFNPWGAGFIVTSYGGGSDIFISKLDGNGNHVWTKQCGGIDYEYGHSIKLDPSGNIYVTGLFSGIADFDPGPGILNLTQTGAGFENFVLRLDANGNLLWAANAGGGIGSSSSPAIAVDNAGNAYIAGMFTGTYDFNPGPGVNNLSSPVGRDFFILKLAANGGFSWVRHMNGSSADDFANNITLDASGNVLIIGGFQNTVDFDPGTAVYNLTSFGALDIFVCKLDNNGNFLWAKQMGGAGSDMGFAVATGIAGDVYTTGIFGGTGDFDPGICVYSMSPLDNIGDVFLSKLDVDCNFLWAKQMGGPSENVGHSIAVYPSGNVYTAGYFRQICDFDPAAPVYNLTALGNGDGFIHKMSPCINSNSSAVAITTCRPYTVNCSTYTVSGTYTVYLQNSSGCDSIVTLNLTIAPILITNSSVVACGSYTWNEQTYTTSGIYNDTIVTSTGCDSVLQLQLTILPVSGKTINQSICAGEQYEGYTSSGVFIDTLISANGCDSIRTINLTVIAGPSPQLGDDKGLCPGDSIVLSPGQFDNYLWQDGSSNNNIIIRRPGVYAVTVSNNCGIAMDEIIVTDGICDIFFPSAFTPNNDGKNDQFGMIGQVNLSEFHLSVFNRWGQKVFSTNDASKRWNGSLKGQKQNTGIFVWYCTFKKSGNPVSMSMKGTVALIR
ncbi:MAG TPA: SBBP repeat-containing protein [Chitinophagaceae bacterium]